MGRSYKVAVWPGDGIGPEVTAEAVKVLEATDVGLEFVEGSSGGGLMWSLGILCPMRLGRRVRGRMRFSWVLWVRIMRLMMCPVWF